MPGKKNKNRPSSYERSNKSADNLQKFAEMMRNIITKAKSKNWKQGWLGVKGTILGLPQNISGRTYSGGNSFFLMADTSEKGYNTPVYMTFKQAKDRNLHVNAGEKSVPIFKWGLSIKDEKGKTVSEEDYNAMSKEERDKFSVRPYPKVYHVFNIDQTNLSEVNKKKYDAIVARFKAPDEEVKDSKGMYINDALDRMFKEKAWHCDIRYNKPSSRAFYVPSQDFIVLPMKEQFNIGKTAEEVYRDGMEYYSTALHEMAHSTGHESRLNRQFGAKRTEGYAHEELIAEMTAALVGSTMGFDKKILENNANYLKGWLENLKRNPESITTIMSDVGKASDMIIEKIDEQRVALGQTPLKEGNLEGLTEDLGEETQQSSKISNTEVPQEEVSEATVTSSERQDDDISNILDNKPLIEKVFYGEFNLPEWSIPYLKDGNEYGLTAEQLKTVKDFEKDFPSKLSIEMTESSIEGNHNTELGPATTVDKAKIYYFEQHISDLFPTDESTRDRLDKDLSEDNKNRKTLSDLQAQYSNINAQYPAAVNDERTRQLAMRINQASQIISEYSNNIKAVYGQDFMFSEAANKVMIPQSIYSGQLKPLSVVQDQGADQEKKVSVPDSLQVPVWEAYEKEKSQTGDFTYQDTAEEYGNMLLKGVENILPRIKGTLTIDQWGSDVLSAKIENDPRIFDTYIIPEPLKAWLEVSPKEESHSNMQGSSTGKNVDIVAAYAFSTILLQKENQEVGLSFTIDGKQWDNYDEIMQGNSDHVISDEAFAAAWALQSSMGISKHNLSKNAVAVLKDHIDTTEYYGEPTLNGSKGGIELLQSGKVSADYSVKGQQVTVEASPKIEEELHTEQEKKVSVPDSLQVPVWEAYEKEKGNPGENTYQNTVDDYTKKLITGVEDILPNVDAVVNVNEKGEKSLAINLWHNPYRTIVSSYIPEPLEKWLDLTTVKEPVANSKDKWLLSGHIEGDKHFYNNSQIVAAYMVSDLLLGKERDFLSLPMSYSNGDKQYTEDFRKDSSITREENAAFIAIEESKGINQEYLIPSAITNLERKIKNDRYHLEGSEGAIDLLKSGQISAAYTEILSKSENLDNASKVEESIEETSLSEDSNPETNVASIAKNIMEKGNVPKEVAEKQATVIADAQQAAIEEKKQKAEQAKQAALKKAEDERRREVEEEKRREEENNQQEKDSGPSSKLLLHAALLLGALELAKGNKGIWMNKAGKSNAEFIGAKRPIMAYNNIMMNLQSDRQGYHSNVYTTYDSAKDAGMAVKQNEESLAFNWVKWDYQHVGTKELISREDYDKLPAEEKEFYTKHKSKEEYGIFNIDQTTMPAGKQADYTALLKDKGAKIDQLSERGVSSMMKFAEKLKSNHPTSMVIARTDSKYQIYGKDASRAGKLLNLPVSQTEENGQKVKSVSFPLDRINDYLPKLVEAKQWVVVAENLDSAELIRQLPNEKEVISNANQTAQRVAKSAGIGYERVMVLQDAAYDKQADKIIVSGMSDKDAGDSRQAALQKANDIYRAVVAATGSEHRLDRMGRNNLLPVDDAKYDVSFKT